MILNPAFTRVLSWNWNKPGNLWVQVVGFHFFGLFFGCKWQMEVRREAEHILQRVGLGETVYLSRTQCLSTARHWSELPCIHSPAHTLPYVYIKVLLQKFNSFEIMWMGFSYFPSATDLASFLTNKRKLHKELLVLVWVSKLHHALC